MDRYNALADATMMSLLERLEDLLDEMTNEGFEVDYHVSGRANTLISSTKPASVKQLMDIIAEWCTNPQPWFEWDIRDQ